MGGFGRNRDLLEMMHGYMEFFVEESCGYCTPCRVGNVLLRDAVTRVREGKMEPGDIKEMKRLAETVRRTSRCGLGQTSPNPILSTLKNFPHLYDELVEEAPEGRRRSFDL